MVTDGRCCTYDNARGPAGELEQPLRNDGTDILPVMDVPVLDCLGRPVVALDHFHPPPDLAHRRLQHLHGVVGRAAVHCPGVPGRRLELPALAELLYLERPALVGAGHAHHTRLVLRQLRVVVQQDLVAHEARDADRLAPVAPALLGVAVRDLEHAVDLLAQRPDHVRLLAV